MATIDALAQGDVLRYDQVERLPISTALFKLTYDKAVNAYQERLARVLTKKRAKDAKK